MAKFTGDTKPYWRKKKGKQLLEGCVMAHEEIVGLDLIEVLDLDKYPVLDNLSKRNQGIIAMKALGMSVVDISEAFGVSRQMIKKVCTRIDPNGMFTLDAQARKAFTARLCENKAIMAAGSISYSELKECTAVEKARVTKTLLDVSSGLMQTKHRTLGTGRLDALIQQVEMEQAEVIEVPEADVKAADSSIDPVEEAIIEPALDVDAVLDRAETGFYSAEEEDSDED